MSDFDNKINKLLKEYTGMSGMMNMSSDKLDPAPGWEYVHDEDEETANKDHDGDGEVESPEEEYKGVKDKAIKKSKKAKKAKK